MTYIDNTIFYVEDARIIPTRNEVVRNGETKKIPAKSIQLLQYMVLHAGEIITYSEANEKIWSGKCTDNSFYQQIANLRKALGDSKKNPNIIQTVAKQGYRFIGKYNIPADYHTNKPFQPISQTDRIHTKSHTTNSIESYLPSLSGKQIFISLITTLILSVYIATILYKGTSSFTFAELVGEINEPESIVIIVKDQEHKELSTIVDVLTHLSQHHLETKNDQLVSVIPKYVEDKIFYNQLSKHYHQLGKVGYILAPYARKENGLLLGLSLIDIERNEREDIVEIFSQDNDLTSSLVEFEKSISEIFQQMKLAKHKPPVLSNSESSTLLFLETIKNYEKHSKTRMDIENSIASAEKAIDSNPSNLVSYKILWIELLNLIRIYSEFNLTHIVDLLDKSIAKAIEIDPDYYWAIYIQADKDCWLGLFETCHRGMRKTINYYPYAPKFLDALYWRVENSSTEKLELAKKNYIYNPFYSTAFSSYRNSLLYLSDFHSFSELAAYQSTWSGPSDWFLQAQSSSSLDLLKKQSEYYNRTYSEHSSHSITEEVLLPSKYIAYSLLNANKVDLAYFWSKNGAERDLPYFDIKLIPLLANIWSDNWNDLEWQALRSYVMDRKKSQNALDKLTIAYFDFYSGSEKKAEEVLLSIYPELKAGEGVINNGTIRLYIYYTEIQKRKENFAYVNKVAPLIEKYLEENINIKRGIDFGISDVEYYALNNEKKKAISRLKDAIENDNWLPNSLWLWPPIQNNKLLRSIHNEKEVVRLSKVIEGKLDDLCFKKNCNERQ